MQFDTPRHHSQPIGKCDRERLTAAGESIHVGRTITVTVPRRPASSRGMNCFAIG
jgi:hypothetical protein